MIAYPVSAVLCRYMRVWLLHDKRIGLAFSSIRNYLLELITVYLFIESGYGQSKPELF